MNPIYKDKDMDKAYKKVQCVCVCVCVRVCVCVHAHVGGLSSKHCSDCILKRHINCRHYIKLA